jgi:hypothetical protein
MDPRSVAPAIAAAACVAAVLELNILLDMKGKVAVSRQDHGVFQEPGVFSLDWLIQKAVCKNARGAD